MGHNLFNSLRDLVLESGTVGKFYSLPALENAGVAVISRLPVSIRIVLESILRNCDGKKVSGITYKDRTTDEVKQVALEGIFVQIGLLPNTDWLKGTVELSSRGEIIVDDHGRTSVPGVFAAGDVTTTPFKQIIIAMGEGAKASLSAFDHLIRN